MSFNIFQINQIKFNIKCDGIDYTISRRQVIGLLETTYIYLIEF